MVEECELPCYKIPSSQRGSAGSPSSCSISTSAGRVSEHACWSLEALIKSRLSQKLPRNFQRVKGTESGRSEMLLVSVRQLG